MKHPEANASFERKISAQYILIDAQGFPETFPTLKDAKICARSMIDRCQIYLFTKEVTTIEQFKQVYSKSDQ